MTTTTRPTGGPSSDNLPIDTILHGDALAVLRTLPDNCIDAVCVDPPAGISFMNKEFDHDKGGRTQWIAWLADIMSEVLRVTKPGGHAFVWALPRTSHWTMCALEDAGWEIREKHYHLFSTGMSKGLNVSKAIDAHLGMEREVVGEGPYASRKPHEYHSGNALHISQHDTRIGHPLTSPASPAAQQYDGWFSGTKPAAEEWILCRKPLSEKSIVENVLKWGTGALNIESCRVALNGESWDGNKANAHTNYSAVTFGKFGTQYAKPSHSSGRFPSNVVFSHSLFCSDEECSPDCAVLVLERQSGVIKSGKRIQKIGENVNKGIYSPAKRTFDVTFGASEGTAARFYHCFPADQQQQQQEVPFIYTAKASSSERNRGIPRKIEGGLFEEYAQEGIEEAIAGAYGDFAGDGRGRQTEHTPATNTHPTIKSIFLISYLCKMITPPNGLILDCFFGSGTLGVAAIENGFHFIGIEQEEEYVKIAQARVQHALHKRSLSLTE